MRLDTATPTNWPHPATLLAAAGCCGDDAQHHLCQFHDGYDYGHETAVNAHRQRITRITRIALAVMFCAGLAVAWGPPVPRLAVLALGWPVALILLAAQDRAR